MLELWLNKPKEATEVRNNIIVVEPSGGIDTKKLLIKNLNPENIRKIEAIVKDLLNLYANDSKLDEDLENCSDSLRHKY